MTTQTVSQAVDKRDQGAAAIVRQSRSWFATIVPSHVDAAAFVALTVGYLRRNPKLADAANRNPASFMASLSECARLGLVPGDTFHCVPFEDRRNETVEITGIVDYKGEIELIYRAGAVASVKAEIVCQADQFHFTTDMDRPEHSPNWFGDRGPLIGAYAYAVMKDGATSKVIVYSKAEIDRVMAVSKTKDRADSPWKLWYDRMALKTVLHRLAHFVPTSAEYRREQLRAAAEVAQQVNTASLPAAGGNGAPPPVAAPEPEDIHDAEIVPEPQPERRRPGKRELAARQKLHTLLTQLPLGSDMDKWDVASFFAGAQVKDLNQLSPEQVATVTAALEEALTAAKGDARDAADRVWRVVQAGWEQGEAIVRNEQSEPDSATKDGGQND